MPKNALLIFLLFLFITTCGNKKNEGTAEDNTTQTDSLETPTPEKVFPEVSDLSKFSESTFLATLETNFNTEKNGIYAAPLLFAWEEIRQYLKKPIQNIKGDGLKELNASQTFLEVLKKGEYTTEIKVEGFKIIAKAFFQKSLPFDMPFSKNYESFNFKDTEVASFGFWGSHSNANLLYYTNDDDFAIRLLPEDAVHEIILMKTNFTKNTNLGTEVKKLENAIKLFKQNQNAGNEWRYVLNEEDRTIIPNVAFNIEHNYENILGNTFSADERDFQITKAYQRTAFVLNEEGAEVESEAEIEAEDAIEELPEEEIKEKPQPKKLFFDKSYLILLKRKDNPNPYFAMFVATPELLEEDTKEE